MSVQTQIDQYFKSTSSNRVLSSSAKKKCANVSDRSNTSYIISSKNGPSQSSRSFGISSIAMQASLITVSTDKSSTVSPEPESRSSGEKWISLEHPLTAVHATTPTKKTIRGFLQTCNSPSARPSPGKISLKRQARDSPGVLISSKKLQNYRENIAKLPETRPRKILHFFRLPEAQIPSKSCEDISQNDKHAGEIGRKFCAEISKIVPRSSEIENSDENDDNLRETKEQEPNIQRKDDADNNQSNSGQIQKKLTPKKRKFVELSSSKNLSSSSNWEVVASIETPNRWMTALSTNWQTILDDSRDSTKSSMNCSEGDSQETVEALSGVNEKFVEDVASTARDGYNACVKETSPPRALLSQENSQANEANCKQSDCAASPLETIAENAVPPLSTGTKTTSYRKNVKSTNSRMRINDGSDLPMDIAGPSQISSAEYENSNSAVLIERIANLPTEINGAANLPMEIGRTANLLTKIDQVATSTTKIGETLNLTTKIGETINSTTKIGETINSTTKIGETVNSTAKIGETTNSTTKIGETINSTTKIGETINSTTKIGETINSTIKIDETINLTLKICETASSTTRIIGALNLPANVNETSSSAHKPADLPKTPTKVHVSSSTPAKSTNLPKTPTKRPTNLSATPSKSSSSTNTSKSSFSPRVKYKSPRVHKERVDTHLASRAVENLNQVKQGIIPQNEFDLELIFSEKAFEFKYGSLNANAAIKYEARDVRVPKEQHADHFFMVLVNVFAEPVNCGYFNEDEIDTIFATLTLSPEAQSLLVRILKRKRGWFRVSSIQYPEIAADLSPIFKELVDRAFLDDAVAKADIGRALSLLQVEEVRYICQAMKVNKRGTKPTMISKLIKLSDQKKPLFLGARSPNSVLIERVNKELGSCIRIPENIENLFTRIFILLIPNQDPKENMVEAFRMLAQVHYCEKIFPVTPKKRFPIFRNRLHLIRYAEARSAWNQIIKASEQKDWETVRLLGQLAYDQLKPTFESNDSCDETIKSTLPTHVQRFDADYAWTKVMSISIEGFKKTSKTTAAQFLHALLSPRNTLPGNRTRWYSELAMIESHHRKNFETSAEITIRGLLQKNISEIDAAEMCERARKVAKSKSVSADTKERINTAVRLIQEVFVSTSEPKTEEIEATLVAGNTIGSKSTWSINIGGADTGYLRVEEVALRHYLGKGFRGGVHCEGALPVTIFASLLWDAIYTIPVPGAFVSSYQDAPLDLYTSDFFESRRKHIEERLKVIRRLDIEYLSDIMHEDFVKYRDYESLVHGKLFENSGDFKDFIKCLGVDAVVGICERLASNYNQWKSGFPDLAVWNPVTKKCKIVEVKGPGDSLSTKQKLWIQFLECLGVEVEVCVVKGSTRRYAM